MRIAHIEAGRHLYGGAAQVRYLLEGLTGRGVDNVLVCARGSELGASVPGVEVCAMPLHGELDVGMLPRLVRALRGLDADLVHVHSRRGADLYGGFAAALAGIPAVLTRRVDAAEPALLARLKYRPYEVVVALSRAIERQLLATGLARERVALIPSGIDTERLRPDVAARGRVLAQFALPADALVIGVVAQLIERKGHSLLLAALPELIREWPQLRVLCFGRGALERRLRNELAERGLGAHVELCGFRTDLPKLVPGLDLLVHPAAREGLGLALLEAGAAGVPVVACAAGGVPDVVIAGQTGVLVPVGDAVALRQALAQLCAAPHERRRLGAAARTHVERRFDARALVDGHLSLYERVLGERAASAAPTVPR
jgi:glycosyltransferase involved in cell wall biosynthesis